MKLLKVLNKSFNKSFKKLNAKMALLLLACVCLVVIGIYFFKKQRENFSVEPIVKFKIEDGKLVRDDNNGTHKLIKTGEYSGTNSDGNFERNGSSISKTDFPKDHQYYYCTNNHAGPGTGFVYASKFQADKQCGNFGPAVNKIKQKDAINIDVDIPKSSENRETKFKITNGKLIRDDINGTHTFLHIGEYKDIIKYPVGHYFYYANTGAGVLGLVFPTKYQAYSLGSGTRIQLLNHTIHTIDDGKRYNFVWSGIPTKGGNFRSSHIKGAEFRGSDYDSPLDNIIIELVSGTTNQYTMHTYIGNDRYNFVWSNRPTKGGRFRASHIKGAEFRGPEYDGEKGPDKFIIELVSGTTNQYTMHIIDDGNRYNFVWSNHPTEGGDFRASNIKGAEFRGSDYDGEKGPDIFIINPPLFPAPPTAPPAASTSAASTSAAANSTSAAANSTSAAANSTSAAANSTSAAANSTSAAATSGAGGAPATAANSTQPAQAAGGAPATAAPTTNSTAQQQSCPTLPQKVDEYMYTGDVSHIDCLEKCLDANVKNEVCLKTCGDWAKEHQKQLENCFFRPGGLTPGDCKTRCEDYYNIVGDSVCSKTCETVCNNCETSNCKWTNFQSEEEFPYQLSLFGVPGNGKVKISWEKPPYVVQKYIIMYFEEEKQHETGVKFIEKYGSACDNGEYCSFTIGSLSNHKNYIIGVSAIFQNGSMTRMSNRLVMRPEDIPDNNEEEEEEDNTTNNTTQNTTVQTQTPTRILAGALLREKRKANSQKILTDFNKSQSEHVSDLFSYLATNPINLQFKLS